ncbi:alpha-galactosidase [Asanoa siamensis]|uniref:alpha-galactosidase n=1 Tax=Asanoa siamensis TaxID=926357 RepID=A0ABQ4CZF5_9ACTN|nr:alpha-galactosidase [Asanoa siamensis]GIF76669.1 alpha-galactosidase [Asanoa siamensis]
MQSGANAVIALRAGGAAFVVEIREPVPAVLHWGADLDAPADDLRRTAGPAVLNNSPDSPRVFSVWPTERDGWSGTPAQSGNFAGYGTTPRPVLAGHRVDVPDDGVGGRLELSFTDGGLRGTVVYELDRFGVLAVSLSVGNSADRPYTLDGLLALLPVPDRAVELVDFTGKWCRERAPQRAPFGFGTHLRATRRGKPGHDSPYLLMAGTSGFGFGHGEIWAAHLAWSGEQRYLAERLPEGAGAFAALVGAGESLRSGEVILAPGERYDAPPVLFVWSGEGTDGVADRLHRRLRARPGHPVTARPLVLNTWEAVYFDHDLDRLTALVERAASVGVERIVLDDGWFRGRRAADAGLGDWFVDADVWPDGLEPFVKVVRAHGMQFGLWFEPEMVNLDSELARAHPDWILGPADGLGPSARRQYVLDIARPDAYAYLLSRLDALVAAHGVDHLKWDHNRDLLEAVSRPSGRPGVRRQTLALYRLLDELRARHPGLEIETCSGGGGRVDFGILDRTDRVWASDCNDPVERAQIERWTRVLVPPELIGSHLGAARSHTTSRTTDLSFRLAVSLTAHAGIEQDLTAASPADLAIIAAWSALYREFRPLLHTGRVVNADLADDAVALYGTVARDGSRALFTWLRFRTSPAGQTGRVRFPGLDPAARYRVVVRTELGAASRHQADDPDWVAHAPIELSGAVLAVAGVPLPTLNPQQAMLFDIERTS